MSNQVWVLGDAVVDLIPDSRDRYLKCPGGAPANVAVAVSRLGSRSSFIGRVGQDPLGEYLKTILERERVNTEYLTFDINHRTSTVIINLDKTGERSFTFMVKPSADQFLQVGDLPHFAKGEWLHCCSNAFANEPSRSTAFKAIQAMQNADGFVSFDPNLRSEVWLHPEEMRDVVKQVLLVVDLVKFSEEELLWLTETSDIKTALNKLKSVAIPLVVITQGKQGALLSIKNKEPVLYKGKAAKAVDTTGAGDAFVGGLLAVLVQENNWFTEATISKAMAWANSCGRLAISAKGAMTALPTRETLIKELSTESASLKVTDNK
ncbi:aminoimidazole riboside kinase [Zooshikella sp. RANM57]|uniref:aminoimidazole riboside kinase n=1 Tax=Zooshikella sp. RANM57 TaxID=3425863 RepID=UPI003D6E4069